ncbi:MAG: hypothetical protein K2Y02_01740, partial [Burkholderiaceae bacterium]|nr:hypothetical protein [Burkholderiaceae bacterium]
SARLPSDFLLLPQKKVTKEEGPNTSDLSGALRLHISFNGSGPRTPTELLQRVPRSHSDDSVSTRLDPAGHRDDDPQGRAETRTSGWALARKPTPSSGECSRARAFAVSLLAAA